MISVEVAIGINGLHQVDFGGASCVEVEDEVTRRSNSGTPVGGSQDISMWSHSNLDEQESTISNQM
ncbi:hypothetical protein PGTUg99_006708, partial [Puccinia graminis f. sp. tritici]